MKGLGFASISAVRQYVRFAQDQRLDVDAALRAAGIPAEDLEQASGRVSGERFQALILNLIEQSGNPLFGLQSGDYVQPGSYNVLGYIVMSCATLGEAIARIAPYEKLVGDMGVTTLETVGDRLLLRWHCNYTHTLVRRHMIDNVLASWVNYARWLGDQEDAGPLEVWLEHEAAAPAQAQAYERVFRCPVRFGQTACGLLIGHEHLSLRLRQPDQILRRTLEDHAQSQILALAASETELSIRVRSTIRNLLRAGISRVDSIAEHLGMNSRTLQRRLKEQGSSYQILLDEVRQELAQDYLTTTALPLPEIAFRLGFAEPRSFYRRFKSWTGLTPGDYRAQHLAQTAEGGRNGIRR